MNTCVWCGKQFERPARKGPNPVYCSGSHRSMAYQARRIDRAVTSAVAAIDRELTELERRLP